MRYGTLDDYAFVNDLILQEAPHGVFAVDVENPAAIRGLEVELKSILTNQRRVNGTTAYILISETVGVKKGFVAISAFAGNKGNELWLAAVPPTYRGKGECRRMLSTVFRQFKENDVGVMARCAPAAQAMIHILTTSGFIVDATLPKGTLQLASPWRSGSNMR